MKRLFLLVTSLFFFGNLVTAQVQSTFVKHSERWTIVPNKIPVKHKKGGPTNGFIFGSDFVLKNQAINWFFTAPKKFLRNQSTYFKGTLFFRMRQLRKGNKPLNGFYDVVIIGANGRALVYKLPLNPRKTWTPYRIGLRADDPNWRIIPAHQVQVNTTKNPWFQKNWPNPNNRQIYAILKNIKSFHIRGEYVVGDDACALDDVQFIKPPTQKRLAKF